MIMTRKMLEQLKDVINDTATASELSSLEVKEMVELATLLAEVAPVARACVIVERPQT